MKIYIFIFTLIANYNYLYCQNTKLDSFLNEYSRQFRMELNKSDTVLIHSLLAQIKEECSLYDSVVISNDYSNAFIKELTKQVANANCCNSNIIDNIYYYSPIAGELLAPTSYPVFSGVVENENIKMKMKNFLFTSEYLSDCFLLSERKPLIITYLARIIFDKKTKNEAIEFSNDCKSANLRLLQIIYQKNPI